MREHEADMNQRGSVRRPGVKDVRVVKFYITDAARGGFFARQHKLAFVEVNADDAAISPDPLRQLEAYVSARAAGVDHSEIRKRLEGIEQRLR
ncbi:hypothetical protein [Mesorhizobium sp. L2C067A000]|uniref:hypothetical protein n=1 Tax=Mesorhizobium sp. L2C067A000 TaxID=1287106 RepID=UPI0003CFC7AD|nr:hypothetical protein [Mesorhizobium sp. L2C067A000]ESZ23744.1 hypothetical protein X733_32760 [Mesorhizobium sp. L2C067A000]